jgi:hypothetical protein
MLMETQEANGPANRPKPIVALKTIKLALALGCTINYEDGSKSRSSPR